LHFALREEIGQKNQLIQTKMMKNGFQIILTGKYVELKAKIKQSKKKSRKK
jgi:hypothetical protein